MATTKTTKVLNAVNQEATIWCDGMAKVGISIRSVTGTVVLSFFGSVDGLQFTPLGVGAYPSATPPATVVTTTATAGSWETNVQNYNFVRVQMTTGSGPATVVIAASTDGAYQEVFNADAQGVSSAVMFPSTTSSAGVNTMTIPAQANRAINLTYLEVAMVAPQPTGNAQLRIWDGAVGNGVPLYSCYLAPGSGSVGTTQLINLPKDAQGNVGLQSTPGNVMTCQIINLGGITAIMNARNSYL